MLRATLILLAGLLATFVLRLAVGATLLYYAWPSVKTMQGALEQISAAMGP